MIGFVQNADLDRIYDSQDFDLGAIYMDNQGRKFRFCKYNQGDHSVAAVAGRLGIGLDSAYPDWEVTMDYASGTITAIGNDQKGFFQAALTDEKYGWLQVTGKNKKAGLTDGSVAQGELLMKHAGS